MTFVFGVFNLQVVAYPNKGGSTLYLVLLSLYSISTANAESVSYKPTLMV